MSYDQKDKSTHDGAPIECYEFISQHKTWRYTSYQESVTVAGEVFEPLQITRTALEIGSIVDTLTTMDFNIPSDHEIAHTFCFLQSPGLLLVAVYRVHEGDNFETDYKVEYQGELSGATAQGNWAVIKTASIVQTRLSGNLNSIFYQRTCNHTLYDSMCKAVRADHTEEAVVTKIQGQLITVNDPVYGDGELAGGEMTNTRTGEKQGIVANTGLTVSLGYQFFDLQVGDTVELTQGCDHARLGHCKNRFNNVVNYGGFDHIPEKNPFEALNFQTIVNTTTRVREEQKRRVVSSVPSARSI